jgi:hypothetical protein
MVGSLAWRLQPNPAADQTATSEPAVDAAPAKMSASDFAGALKDLFDRYEQSDGNTGAPAVKSAIRDIWMRTGGTEIKETYTDDEYQQAMQDFLARGGRVEQGTYKEPRLKTRIRRQGSRHIGLGREPQASRQAGRGANVGGKGKPVVTVEGLTWSQDFDPSIAVATIPTNSALGPSGRLLPRDQDSLP